MLISVDHVTHYTYETITHYIAQRIRLTPQTTSHQSVREWEILMPGIENAVSYIDGFGNLTMLVTNQGEFDQISIRARGLVETLDASGIVGEDVSGLLAETFLRSTPCTESDKALKAFSRTIEPGETIPFLHRVMMRIHEEITYDTDATHAHTTAKDAFAARRGVCQDHSHIFISLARLNNIPARYVTGYLLFMGDGSPELAQHAWAEAHVEGLGWVGFDPANGVSPGETYIRIACGLDANSAAPISGIRRGGGDERLDVSLDIQHIQQQ